MARLGTPLLIHQPSYSMLNRWIEDGLLDVLDDEGVGCIAFSPLAQGLLSDRYLKGVPEGSRASRNGSLSPRDAQRIPWHASWPERPHDVAVNGWPRWPSPGLPRSPGDLGR